MVKVLRFNSERVSKRMIRLRMTKAELAQKMGKHPNTVNAQLKPGNQEEAITLKTIGRYGFALGLDPKSLIVVADKPDVGK